MYQIANFAGMISVLSRGIVVEIGILEKARTWQPACGFTSPQEVCIR